MNTVITLDNTTLLRPKVCVCYNGLVVQIPDPRWIQLISLLVFKLTTGIDEGQVSCSELRRSLKFRDLGPENISRILKRSMKSFRPIVAEFMDTCISLPENGPFRLRIPSQLIQSDYSLLEAYIYLIFGNINTKTDFLKTASEPLQLSLREFEFQSARFFLSNFIQNKIEHDRNPLSLQALAHINLATIDYLLLDNNDSSINHLRNAKILVNSLKPGDEQILLKAHLIETQVWMTPMEVYNARSTIRANNEAIELASRLARWNSERAAILASRHYHSVYTALRYGTSTDVNHELAIVYELHKQLRNYDPPEIIPYEPDSLDLIQLQMSLIRRLLSKIAANEEDIAQYGECVVNPRISALNTLSAAEWIGISLLRTGQMDQAKEFLNKAIVSHAALHRTALYARVMRLIRES